MTYHSIKNVSYSASIGFHILVLLLLLLLKFSIEGSSKEYVELSFGVSGKEGSSGNIGEQVTEVEEMSKTETKNETQDRTKEVKQVDLPKAKATSEDNNIRPAEKDKKITKENKTQTKKLTNSEVTSTGQGNKAEGEGSFGYISDWGGMGQRKIYSHPSPIYPEGVQKEVEIKFRFSILPDGTVGTIFPITKADTRLEDAAINALRQWRFEPLDSAQMQVEQSVVIVAHFYLQ